MDVVGKHGRKLVVQNLRSDDVDDGLKKNWYCQCKSASTRPAPRRAAVSGPAGCKRAAGTGW